MKILDTYALSRFPKHNGIQNVYKHKQKPYYKFRKSGRFVDNNALRK